MTFHLKENPNRTSRNQKEKASRKDAKTQRNRKAFLCDTFAALTSASSVEPRLCVKVLLFKQRFHS